MTLCAPRGQAIGPSIEGRPRYEHADSGAPSDFTKVLRYPRFQQLYGLTDAELLEYAQFLQSISTLVSLDSRYRAPLRDPYDLIVLQTAELGEADILCTHDDDFYDHTIRAYCAARGIEVCDEASLLKRLT